MGKAIRWVKSLLGMKTQHSNKPNNDKTNNRSMSKQNMGFVVGVERMNQSSNSNNNNKWFKECMNSDETENEQSKHAIAVAAATAAAADAALAAAQAAVAVVRLTSKGRGAMFYDYGTNATEFWAALKIQSFFRGYLARRAHRALKGLVKLQAHVRGFLVRKRAEATLHSMQALVRAQATVRSQRANQSLVKNSKSQSELRPRRSTEKFEETKNDQYHSKRLSTAYEPCNNPCEGSPKIVEIDTFKPRSRSRRISNPSFYDFGNDDFQYPTMSSPLPYPLPARLSIPESRNIHYPSTYDWAFYGDENRVSTAHSTPRFTNSIRSNGPSTPTKSVCGDSFFRLPSNHPNYMGDTQSFRAKLRSHSAPKQRPEGRSKKGLSLDEIMAARNSISGVRMQRSCSQVQESLNF